MSNENNNQDMEFEQMMEQRIRQFCRSNMAALKSPTKDLRK